MNPTVHILLHSEVIHFVLYIAVSAFISGMPAPTVTSSNGYRWAFSSLNIFAANIHRGTSTTVESSPNFQDALNKQQVQAGQQETVAKPVSVTP